MKDLETILQGYFHDSPYDEALMINIKDCKANPSIFANLKIEMQSLLQLSFEELYDKAFKLAPMGFSSPEETKIVHKAIDRFHGVRVFFEKLYWDIFHDNKNFQKELLIYIDPKTGTLIDGWEDKSREVHSNK